MTRSLRPSPRMRRRTLRGTVALVASLGLIGGLAACATGTAAPDASAERANTVTVGIAGGGPGTLLDPHVFTDAFGTYFDWAFYENLGEIDESGEYRNVLAESFTPNPDATSWTMVLKDGITFQNGNPLTSDDVIFSFNRVLDPATGSTSGGSIATLTSMDRVDGTTVRFNLSAPNGQFDKTVSDGAGLNIIPTDFDPAKPVSTGPWTFASQTPGTEITVTRYDGYHGEKAKLDGVTFLALPDDDARTNALLAGQIDVDPFVRATSIPQIEANPNMTVMDLPSGGFQVITMRTDQGPFADPRVREALRLAVDREQIITVVDGGYGRVGNDVYGIDDADYRDDLVRTRDVEKATQLIAESGVAGTPITLYTIAKIEPMAQIVAQNAREIGLDVTIETRDDATYYSDGYMEYDFAVDPWPALSFLDAAALTDGPYASLPYTRFADPEFLEQFGIATATTDPAVRAEASGKMQEILFDRGGFIIPRFQDQLVAAPTALVGWPATDPTAGTLLMRSLKNVSWQ